MFDIALKYLEITFLHVHVFSTPSYDAQMTSLGWEPYFEAEDRRTWRTECSPKFTGISYTSDR